MKVRWWSCAYGNRPLSQLLLLRRAPNPKKMENKVHKHRPKAANWPVFAQAWPVTSINFFAYLAAIDITTERQTDSSLDLRIIPLTSNPVGNFRVSVSGGGYSKEDVIPGNSTNLVCYFVDLSSATKFDFRGQPCNTVDSTEICGEIFVGVAWTVPASKKKIYPWQKLNVFAIVGYFNMGSNSFPLLRARQTAPPNTDNELHGCLLH